MKLATAPSGEVTVTVTGRQNTDVVLAGLNSDNALLFSTATWNDPQTVTVTAGHDADGADDQNTLTLTAVGGGYDGTAGELAVTVVDDDRGIVLTPAALTVNEGAAVGASFTVKLATAPSGEVTVTVTGRQNTDVVLAGLNSDNALLFSTATWNDPQTVTVTAGHDADGADDQNTLTLTAVGGGYDGTAGELAVTVVDDDRGVVLTPAALTVNEGAAVGASFTVKLATAPSGEVTVTVTGRQNTDVVLAGLNSDNALLFSTATWNDPQTVTVTAGHDADGADDQNTLTLTAVGGGYDGAAGELAVTVVDDDRGIVLTPAALTVNEGAAVGASFTVKLATAPSGEVTVTVTGRQNTDVVLAGLNSDNALLFSTATWNDPQTVTVTAGHDADGADDQNTLTLTAVGGGYDGAAGELAVTVVDDDRGIVLTPAALTVNEGAAVGASFTVKLATAPSGEVTVTVTGRQNTDVVLAGLNSDNALLFSTATWNDPQTVTVTAGHDADGADDQNTLTLTAAGGGYDGAAGELAVTVVDDDRGIVLTPAALTVNEGAAVGASFTVKLATAPSGEVTVTVTGRQNTDVVLAGLNSDNALLFSTATWNDPQTVTVTAGHDADGADDQNTLTLTAVGGGYDGTAGELAVTVVDDDRGIVLTPAALTVNEGAAVGASFTVKLATAPSGEVTVTVTGRQNTDVVLAGLNSDNALLFSTATWNDPQTVTVTAGHDADGADDQNTLTLTAVGGGYDGTAGELAVTVVDDDRGVVLTPAALTVNEGAVGASFTVKLATAPSGEVTVTVTGRQNTDVVLAGLNSDNALLFSTATWNDPQTVTVTAGHDADGADDQNTLTLTAVGGGYDGTAGELAVTVVDDDRGVVLTPAALTVNEGAAVGASFTVKLATAPSGEVTVTVTGRQNTDVVLAGLNSDNALLFSTATWNDPQTVTVTAGHDADGADDQNTLTLTAVGGGYDGTAGELAVTVVDDDRGIVLTPAALTVNEGAAVGASFTVKLATAPSGEVTVTVTGRQNTDVVLAGLNSDNALLFSTATWNDPQTVTVTAGHDADGADDQNTLTLTAVGGGYDGTAGELAVTVVDDDRGIVLTPAALTVNEGAAVGASFTVKLATAPSGEVTVTVTGRQNTDVVLAGLNSDNALLFSTATWNDPQTVTVTAGHDADGADDQNTLTLTAVGGGYDGTAGELAVTVVDDDRGIVLTPAALTVNEGAAVGASFTVKLATAPSGEVTVTVTGRQNTDVVLAGLNSDNALLFSTATWNDPQTVTVTAGHDADGADDQNTLTLTAVGGGYDGAAGELAVTVVDDDRGIVLTPAALTVNEGAVGASFTVKLATAPSGEVTVTVTGRQNTDVVLAGLNSDNALLFSTATWNDPQTVTVTAGHDADGADDQNTLTLTAVGGGYDGAAGELAVTVVDDDRGIVLTPAALTVNEGAAVGASFTVKLATAPSGEVTVTVTGRQNTDVVLAGLNSDNALLFSTATWNDPQTVTVTAGHDADGADDQNTLTLTAAGGGYDGAAGELAVTVVDDDRGIVLTPAALTVNEGAVGASFTVKLATAPSGEVTVTVTGRQNTDVVLAGLNSDNALLFSTATWNDPQTVTVTAGHDADGADDQNTLTLTAVGGGYDGAAGELAVTVVDDDRGIVLTPAALTVNEGAAVGASFTVKLATAPSGEVTVTVTGRQNTDVVLAGLNSDNALLFSTATWNDPQTVTVTAGHDADGADDQNTLTLTAARGGGYDGTTGELAVTVVDDDRGIVLTPAALTVNEGAAVGASFTVKLATAPSGEVTVTVTGRQNTDVVLAGLNSDNALLFSTATWNDPQTVTVTAGHDADGADDQNTLTLTAARGGYDGTAGELAVTVVDDDRGIVLTPAALTVNEGAAVGASFTVKLATAPSGEVTVTVTGRQNTDVVLAGLNSDNALLFSTATWNDPQTVTVTAGHDADGADDQNTLTLTAARGGYDGTTGELAVTVVDDDRGVVLTPAALTVNEGAVGASFTVKLATAPSGEVTVTVTGRQNTDVVLAGLNSDNALLFSTATWNDPQTVTVTAGHDADGADDQNTLTLTAARGGYDGTTGELAVTVVDDDRGVVLTPAALTVNEGAAVGASFTVKLATAPSGEVTVTVTGRQNTDVVLAGLNSDNALLFSTATWNDPQTVTVTAGHDADGADDQNTLTLTAVGGGYDGAAGELAVTVVDDDRGIVLTPAALTVNEGAAVGASFTVKLATAPSGEVTVTVTGRQNTDVVLAGLNSDNALLFSTATWNDPQTVTVTAGHDADGADDQNTLTLTAVGGGYDGTTGELAVTVVDDDRGVVLTPAALTVNEGAAVGASFTVKLATAPSGEVTVTVTGRQNTDVVLAGLNSDNALLFSTATWNDPQTVTVTAGHDADGADDQNTLTLTAVGGGYDGTTGELAVTVVDDDRGVVLTPAALTVNEGAAVGASFTVKLATAPSGEVTVTVTGRQNTDVVLAGLNSDNALLFSTATWNDPQTVTVTAGHDADGADDQNTLTLTAARGGYDGTTGELAVTVVDDDRGVVLTPAALTVNEGAAVGASFTVKLATAPSGEVTVTVTGRQNTDVVLAGLNSDNALLFSTATWNDPQTVTVTAGHDADGADDQNTLTLTAARGGYDGTTGELAVTVVDDDRGVVLTPAALTVNEGAAVGASFTVKLATAPSGEVTVTVTGRQNTDVVLAGLNSDNALLFSTATWNDPQTVTVTAGHDADGADDQNTLTLTAARGGYDGTTAEYAVTVVDDDRGVVLTPAALTVNEGAVGASFTVKLATAPSGEVTVTVTGQQNTDVVLAGLNSDNALLFSTATWNDPQTVTVTAGHDADGADDQNTLTLTAARGGYDGTTGELAVTVVDDDRGIVLTPAALTVNEGAAVGASFTVKLATAPSGEVTVTVTGRQNTDVVLAGLNSDNALLFSTATWNDPQTVTVTAGHDADGADDQNTLTLTAVGGGYDGAAGELAVTVVDDDRGIVLTPAALTVNEGAAVGASFTVKLATAPSGEVTVTVTGQQNTDVVLAGLNSDNALLFSTATWNDPQTVTVTAGHDADGADDQNTLTLTAARGGYDGAAGELAVTVVDDDRGIVLTPAALTVNEGAAGASFTVKLATAPSGEVTVTVTGQQNTDVVLAGLNSDNALLFSTATWNDPQTVTVTAGHDADGADDQNTLTLTAVGGGYDGAAGELAVTVVDDDRGTENPTTTVPTVAVFPTLRVILSKLSLTVCEGDTVGETYSVQLSHRPSADVTVTLNGDDRGDLTLKGLSDNDTLTFTTGNWHTPQTVTVAADNDNHTAEDPIMLTHTAYGGGYRGAAASLAVTAVAIVLSESALTVSEGDAAGSSYTVKLSRQPTVDVTVTITNSGSDGDGLTVTPASLTFTASDWNTARTVTVTASQDDDAVDETITLTHTAAGGEYSGAAASLAVVEVDADTAAVVLSESSLTVSEGDPAGDSYTVRLSHRPTVDVTVAIGDNGSKDGDLVFSGLNDTDMMILVAARSRPRAATAPNRLNDTDTLAFTPADWDMPRTVTVTASQDDDAADDTFMLTHSAVGGEYSAADMVDLEVRVYDDETVSMVLSKSSVIVCEGDPVGDSYTVALSHQPSADVTVAVTGHADSDLTLNGLSDAGTLTFTTANWDTAQKITVASGRDSDTANETTTLTHSATGGEYSEAAKAALDVTEVDIDIVAVVLSESALTVDEGNTAGESYTVALSHQPSVDVTVTVSGAEASDLTLSGVSDSNTLTFTTANWDTAQTISVTAGKDTDGSVDDGGVGDGASGTTTLSHTAAGGEYTDATADLAVTIVAEVRGEAALGNDEGDPQMWPSHPPAGGGGTVTASAGKSSSEAADDAEGADDYSVELKHEPSEDIVMPYSGEVCNKTMLGGLSVFGFWAYIPKRWKLVQATENAAGTIRHRRAWLGRTGPRRNRRQQSTYFGYPARIEHIAKPW